MSKSMEIPARKIEPKLAPRKRRNISTARRRAEKDINGLESFTNGVLPANYYAININLFGGEIHIKRISAEVGVPFIRECPVCHQMDIAACEYLPAKEDPWDCWKLNIECEKCSLVKLSSTGTIDYSYAYSQALRDRLGFIPWSQYKQALDIMYEINS